MEKAILEIIKTVLNEKGIKSDDVCKGKNGYIENPFCCAVCFGIATNDIQKKCLKRGLLESYEMITRQHKDIGLNDSIEQCQKMILHYKGQYFKNPSEYWKAYIVIMIRFYEHVKDSLTIDSQTLPMLPPQQTETKTEMGLTVSQIALKYVYAGEMIRRDNAKIIAEQYGHSSGKHLYDKFTYFSSPANRKARPNNCTAKSLEAKIFLLESVIPLLPKDKQNKALDEVKLLKIILEKEY